MTQSSNVHTAMLSIQSQLVNPIKNAKANYGKYATLPELRDEITPILYGAGLYLTQLVQHCDKGAVLESIITHAETGTSIKSEMPLMLEKQTPQGMGSAITYARRYALCAMLNIAADEDDDGAGAEKKPPVNKAPPKASEPAKPKPPEYAVKMNEGRKKLIALAEKKDKDAFASTWFEYNDWFEQYRQASPANQKYYDENILPLFSKMNGDQ